MDKLELIKPFKKGVAARTNMLKIIDNQELITKLMVGNSDSAVNYLCIKIGKGEKNEKSEEYYRRIDSEIKSAIRNELKLKKSDSVEYDRVISGKMVLFFYINQNGCLNNDLLNLIKEYEFDLNTVIQTLLSLRLKLAYIHDASIHYEIEPVLYNSELYVGAIETSKKGNPVLEALKLELYFTKQNEISLSLHKKVFNCEEVFTPIIDDSILFFHCKNKILREKETLNATSNADRPYMAYSQKENAKVFDQYKNSINYHLTVLLNKLIAILTNASIEFSPIQFKPNYIISEFIKSNKQYKNPLVIMAL